MERLALNRREAAAALGVSLPVFDKLSFRDDFPVVRIGRRVLVPIDGLREWLKRESGR